MRQATCHPNRKYRSSGLCSPCYGRQYRAAHPEVREKAWLKAGIKLTVPEYEAMLAAQEGLCAICRRAPKNRSLEVDHDHKTGQVRGLLCYRCNHRLLCHGVTEEILRRAADYLRAGSRLALPPALEPAP